MPGQDLDLASDQEIGSALLEYENCGDAMRTLNRKGQLLWRATPQMLTEIKEQEREVDAEFRSGT